MAKNEKQSLLSERPIVKTKLHPILNQPELNDSERPEIELTELR